MILRFLIVTLLCATGGRAAVAQASNSARTPPASARTTDEPQSRGRSVAKEATLKAGAYMLVLTPARLGGKPAPRGAEPIASTVRVSVSNNKLNVVSSDGLALSGSASGAHFTLSGGNRGTRLTLTGVASLSGADGDFELTFTGGPSVEGGFVLTSPRSAGLQATRQLQDDDVTLKNSAHRDECDWWCVMRRAAEGEERESR